MVYKTRHKDTRIFTTKTLKKLALWATIWSPLHALFRIMQGFETVWAVRPYTSLHGLELFE